jgi:hypothetical protein
MMLRDAELSACGRYRYGLWRTWDQALPQVAFVMLNPSTADAEQDDPTIRRCIGFARLWGYGSLAVGNLFAYRATDPRELPAGVAAVTGPDHYGDLDPAHPYTDFWLGAIADVARVVVAWGAHPRAAERAPRALELLAEHDGGYVECVGITKHGAPRHPLYVRADARLRQYWPEPRRHLAPIVGGGETSAAPVAARPGGASAA